MADEDPRHTVDDPSGLTHRLERQLDLAKAHDHDGDARAMVDWANSMLVADLEPATVTNRLNPIRKLAERAERPLVDFDSADEVTNLLAALKDGSHASVKSEGLASGTLRQYRQAARLFFRDQLGYEWGDDIDIGQPEPTPITEEQVLTSDEVSALLDACDDDRDAAFLSFAVVTGQRISALLSIRVGDVNLGERTATITLNDDATGLKGASGPRPVLWARPYVASWLRNHPRNDEPDAPLFCATQSGRRPTEDREWISWDVGDHLSPSQMRNRLRDVADDAGIDSSKVKPHNLRHTAVTRMRDNGTPDDRIRFMIGVEADSSILERYDQAENERMLARIRDEHGIDTEGEAVGQPSVDVCPQCATPVRDNARFCASCGMPFTEAAAEVSKEAKANVADDMLEFDDIDEQELARMAMSELETNAEFQAMLIDELRNH